MGPYSKSRIQKVALFCIGNCFDFLLSLNLIIFTIFDTHYLIRLFDPLPANKDKHNKKMLWHWFQVTKYKNRNYLYCVFCQIQLFSQLTSLWSWNIIFLHELLLQHSHLLPGEGCAVAPDVVQGLLTCGVVWGQGLIWKRIVQ